MSPFQNRKLSGRKLKKMSSKNNAFSFDEATLAYFWIKKKEMRV
jgi:hypothetical protein